MGKPKKPEPAAASSQVQPPVQSQSHHLEAQTVPLTDSEMPPVGVQKPSKLPRTIILSGVGLVLVVAVFFSLVGLVNTINGGKLFSGNASANKPTGPGSQLVGTWYPTNPDASKNVDYK